MRVIAAILTLALVGCVPPIKREYQPHDGAPVLTQRESIRETIRGHMGEVRTCFANPTAGRPTLAAKVVLDWLLDKEGNVRNARVKQAFDAKVDACLIAALQSWIFLPPPIGTLDTRISFTFVDGNSRTQ